MLNTVKINLAQELPLVNDAYAYNMKPVLRRKKIAAGFVNNLYKTPAEVGGLVNAGVIYLIFHPAEVFVFFFKTGLFIIAVHVSSDIRLKEAAGAADAAKKHAAVIHYKFVEF